jgi:sulfate adenylyltransferase subunit 1
MAARDSLEALDHGVLRFLTAGSVDDGKSTLIGRLLYDTRSILADQLAAIEHASKRRGQALDLSLATDGLIAEREQGITIDVAYRYFATALRKFIIADAPGHAQYTRNMVTAASTAQLAILLVDVRHGVVEQTQRHAALAHLVGIQELVLAVNKMDLVEYRRDAFEQIVADFRKLSDRIGIGSFHGVPMSALHGDMVVDRGANLDWYRGPTLLQILETIEPPRSLLSQPFRFPVQYVARPAGERRRGYLGRVEAGSIGLGDVVVVLPGGQTTTVHAIRTFDGTRSRAGLHASVTLELADELDVSRGDLIVAAQNAPQSVRSVSADLAWLSDMPLAASRTYALKHTTRDVRARVTRVVDRFNVATQTRDPTSEPLHLNDIGRVEIALAQPIVADRYVDNRATGSFVLIDEATNATVAAGMVR